MKQFPVAKFITDNIFSTGTHNRQVLFNYTTINTSVRRYNFCMCAKKQKTTPTCFSRSYEYLK